jgi:FixJ family two-component response regulator
MPGNKESKLIAIIDDDSSMQDSLQDLIEAAGSTHIALNLRKIGM